MSDAAAARADWWRALAAAPDTARMRAASVLRGEVADLAARALAAAWAEYAAAEAERRGGEGEGEGGDQAAAGERQARAAAAARRAAAAAADAAEIGAAAGDALGAGAALSRTDLAAALRAAASDRLLARIVREAGRAMRALQSARRSVIRRAEGRGGVELVGPEGIGRLIPVEAAALTGAAGDAQRMLALARLVDRRALAWAPDRRRERARRGPVVVAVDESGSMAGDRVVCAKGLALAVATAAARDRRHVLLVGWGTRDECRALRLRPGEPQVAAISDWATRQYCGGTECHVPLVQVPRMIAADRDLAGAADVLLITDGEVDVPREIAAGWRAWAARDGARLILIGVGVSDAGDIARLADHVAYVADPRDPRVVAAAAAALEAR